jgi:hypothetical protein
MISDFEPRPTFTWPWKLAAVLVPLISLLIGCAFWLYQSKNYEEFVPVYLSCLAGGTSLLFATATTDSRRHFFGIIVSPILGFTALILLSQFAVMIIFFSLLSITFLVWIFYIIKSPEIAEVDSRGLVEETYRGIQKFRFVCSLLFGFGAIGVAAFTKPGQIALTYPFVCGGLTFLFPGEFTLTGRLVAWERGIVACFKSLFLGLVVACILMLIIDWASKQLALSPMHQNDLLVLAIGVALIPTHFYYERQVFQWISAVELGL